MKTKKNITDTALKLFNLHGSYSITTRHIAAAMNISPGNLYYHYRNKEDIIRALLEQMIADFNLFIRPAENQGNIIKLISDGISETGIIMYNYRFFFMELSTLLEKDPLLRNMYMNIKKERDDDFNVIFQNMYKAGLIEDYVTERDFSIIRDNIWTLAEFLLQSMYLNRIRITPGNITQRFSHVMFMIRPFLKKEFRDFINLPRTD